MELSKVLRAHSRTIAGKQQLVINAFAKALEVVPRLISQNAGFDSTDILNKLRQKHAAGGKYFGVDIVNDGICDTHETFVWEPSNIKQNAIVRTSTRLFLATPARITLQKCLPLFCGPSAEFGGRGRLCHTLSGRDCAQPQK